ncbi:tetratricopeptide repeat protein [Photobacterium kagoshimensis]|uniref:tetratricopeptide repeat protein n=1 Tax=Photobacterium kagoshimensis TaxID=2910242 RepID=UPI003D0B0675
MSEINKMLSRLAAKQHASGCQHGKNNQQAPLVAAKVTPIPASKTPRIIVGTSCAVLLTATLGWWFGQQPNNSMASGSIEEGTFTAVMAANAAEITPDVPVTAVAKADITAEATVAVSNNAEQPLLTTTVPVKTVSPAPAAEYHQTTSKAAIKVAAISPPVTAQPRVVSRDTPVVKAKAVVPVSPIADEMGEDESLTIEAVELSGQELAKIEYSRAMKAVKAGNSKQAVEFLAKAIQYNPDWIDARQRLSALHYGRGEVRQAILTLQHGLARDSDQPELRLTMAKLLVNESQPQAALTVLSELPNHTPSKYLAMRGALAQQLKDNTRALESYQRLVKSEPFDGRWWLGLGIALERTNDAEKALNAYQQALAMGQISVQTQQFIQQRVSYLQSQGS